MKYVFSFFLFILCGESWAQLTCTYCTVGAATTTTTPLTILASPGTYRGGTIQLTGNSVFAINGTGYYTINAGISQTGGQNYGLTLSSPAAGVWGQQNTGLILAGTSPKSYTGETVISGCFFGGYGDISNATVTVRSNGKIGGGGGQDGLGGTLTVGDLTFESLASKLVVTSMSGTDNTPSLVVVKSRGTNNAGNITLLRDRYFMVDLVSKNLSSGYILKCANGVSGKFVLPRADINNTGKTPFFRWDNTGLYMSLGGELTCDNCSFTKPDNTTVTGTPAQPAIILDSPGTFPGNITLNGACKIGLQGKVNFTLSGKITGTGPLLYDVRNPTGYCFDAGITLTGKESNDYTGQTRLTGGYLVCNKEDMKVAVPGNSIVSSWRGLTHLWCQKDNQLAPGATIDFSGVMLDHTLLHLNGTNQTIAGLTATSENSAMTVVKNNYGTGDRRYFPAGITTAQVSKTGGTLNIEAGEGNRYVFGGRGYIWTGEGLAAAGTQLLTINVKSGTQVIENPGGDISNVIFASSGSGILEFNSTDANNSFGGGVIFNGTGTIKKTGVGTLTTNKSTILKTGGKIRVAEGMFRNEKYGNTYANGDSTQINKAALQVDANAVFEMWGNASIFDGLTGGGTVQNNLGPPPSVNVPPGGGYCWLTLGQNDSQGNPVFGGVIKDNPGNGPVSANGFGVGGIALKKVGSGTQVLRGGNIYTGRTRVSSGSLRLEGNGVLGATGAGGSYGGVLEIANVPSETATVFEHRGDKTQTFTTAGNITNSGTGTLSTYLQSGSGKTIIEGVKSFAGNVHITGGYLGGSGDLSKANTVTVEEGGNIGGGNGETAGGAALTVSNLTFVGAASKLRVTSRGDNTPSLVDVKVQSTATPGPISAANGFTVEVNGAAIVSGYVLKCSNGLTDHLSLPTVVNNTGKSVCFRWDGTGLWLQIGFGNITLTSTSLCLAINPVNLVVTVTASYSDPRDYPPLGAAIDFSLSDPSVKSGEMTITRVQGSTVIATFNGKNQTTSNKSYTVTYDDHQNCAAVTLDATINPQPVLRVSSGSNPTCKGTPVELQATGTGLLTISSATINTTVVSITSSVGLVRAGSTPLGNAVFFATDANGCRSENLSVLVKELPVLDAIPNQSVCSGASVDPYIPPSSGAGETKPTSYQWEMKANALNRDNVGLSNHTADWTKSSISHFIAENTTDGILKRDVTVSAYNSATGCTSASRIYTITVNPSPVITTSGIDAGKLCSGVIYSNALSGAGSWSVYKRGTTETGLSTVSDGTSGSDLQAGTVLTVTQEEIVLTSTATSCKSSALSITIHPSPVITTSGIDAGKLCSGVSYANALSGEGSWSVYRRGTTEAGLSTVSEGTSGSNLQAGTVTAVTVEDVVLTSVATSCKSSALSITIHPSPVITTSGIDVSKLCSGVIYSNALSGAGSWSVYKRGTTETGLSTVSDGTSGSTLQAGIVTEVTVEDVVLTSVAASCKSSALSITIHPSPVITTSGIDVSKLCSGVIYSNALSGAGSWSVYKHGTTEAGLSTVSEGTSGSTLQAGIVLTVTQEEIVLTSTATSCKSSALPITIHPSPVITTSGIDVSKLCSGVIYSNALSGEGSWSVYRRGTTEAGLSTVSDGTSGSNLQAGTVTAVTVEDVVLTSVATSCKSSALTITVNPSPVITTSGIDAGKLCSGVIYSNVLSGEGSWSVYKHGTTEAGRSSISLSVTPGRANLQAGIVTAVTVEDIVLTSPVTSCKSSALTITVNPSPVITTSGIDAGKLCSGVIYSNALSGEGSWSVYKRGTTETGLSTVSEGTLGSDLQAGTVTAVTVEDVVLTSTATSCKSSALSITIHPSPVITTSGIDVSKLCSGVIYSNALSGEGSWSVYKRGTTETGLSTVSEGTLGSDLQAGTVTAVTVEDVVLTSTATSCKSSALSITVNPSPVITTSGIDAGKLCSGVIYSNALSGEGSWSVYKRGTTETGLSTVSEGTLGSDLQAGTVTAVTVEDVVLTSTATSCKSSALSITINPSPVITTSGIDAGKLCSGVIYSNALSGEGSWSVYKRGTTETGLSTVTDGTSGSDLQAGIVTTVTQEDLVLTSAAASCKSSALSITIHPSPVITTSGIDVSKLCSGVSYSNALSGAGSWSVYKRGTTETGLSTVSDGTSGSDLQAGIVTTATQEDVVLTSVAASCKSSALLITVNPNPVITTSGIDAGKLCSGVSYSNALSGAGSWSVYKRGTTEAGLSTVTDGTSGSDLQAGRVTVVTQEDVVLTSGTSGCKSSALLITIHPSPVITTTGIDAAKLCSGVIYSNALSGAGSWSVYKRGTTEAGLSTVSDGTSGSDLQAGIVLTATQEEIVLTSVATSCKSSALPITIHPSPVITTTGIDAGKLCSGVIYSNALSGAGSWSVYKRGTTEAGLSTVSEGTSGSTLQAGRVTEITQEEIVLTSTAASCKSSVLTITVNPSPVITTSGIDVSKLCSGVIYSNALSGEGSWSVYRRGTTDTGLSTVSAGTSGSDLQAGTVTAVTVEDVVLTSVATSCKSSALTITIHPSPVITTSGIDAGKLCSGVIYSNALSGEGSWSVYKRGTTEAGLSTVSDGTSGSDLQAGTVTAVTVEDVVLTSVATSCKSSALTITVNPSPVITTSGIDAGKLCSGVIYSNALSGEGSWSVYKRGTTEAGLSTVSEGTSGSDLQAGIVTVVTVEDLVLTSVATSCKSSALPITIHPSPVITTSGIDAGKLCSGVIYSNALSGAGSWSVYKRGTTEAGLSTVSEGTSGSDLQAGIVTVVTVEDVVLTSTATSCKSSALSITIHPNPVITTSGIDAGKLCSGVIYSNALSGAGSWSVYKRGTTEAGLSTVSDGTSGSDLQAGIVTAVTVEDVVLTSVAASCKSSALSITIHPSPVITTSGIDAGKLCSGVIYSNALSGEGSWSVYQRGTTEAGLSTVSDGTSGSDLQAGRVTEVTQEDLVLTSVATSCKSSALPITIHPSPVITTSGIDVGKLCSGVIYSNALSGEGSWSVYKRGTTETGLSTVSAGTSGSDLQAGTVTVVTVEDVVLTSVAASCKSSALSITIHPSPVITTSGIDAGKLCSGVIYSNALSGEGSWSVYKRGTTDAGLSTVSTGTSGSDLQAGIVTTATQEDVVLTSTATSCKSSVLTITVNPNPVITTSGIDAGKLCSGVIYSNALSGAGSWSVYKRGTTETGLSTVSDGTSGSTLQAGIVTAVTVEDVVLTSVAASCKSSALTITIHPSPVITTSGIDAGKLCSGVIYSNALSGDGSWSVYKRGTTEAGLSTVTDGTLGSDLQAGIVTTVTQEDLVLTSVATSCKSSALTITVNPSPVIATSGIDVSKLCSGVIYSNALSGAGSWSVYKRGTTETGLSTVSEGTSGSDLQAGIVTTATQEDVVLTSTATSCKSSVLTITVNPNPVITTSGIDAGKLCSGVIYSNALSGEGSWSVYKRGTTETGLSTVTDGTSGSDLQAGIVTAVTVEDLVLTSTATSCKSSALTITVNPSPVITTSGIDVSKLCSGVIYSNALSGEGSWSVYKRGTTETGLSTVSDGTSGSDLQAGTVLTVTQEEIVLTSTATSCKSSALSITIYPKPVMNPISNLTTCGNSQVPAYTPASPAGVPEEARTTHYKWKAEAANPTAVGLSDYTADWTQTAISQFTAANLVNTIALKRDITVYAYNSTSGCQAEPQVYTITVNPGPVVTYSATSPICNGIETDVVLRSTLSPTTYTWTVGNNRVGARSQTTASGTSFIRQTLSNRGSSAETVTYKVTGTFGHCSDTVSIAVKVSNADPATPTVSGGGHYCVNIENGSWQTDLKPSVEGKNVEWTYTSYYGNDQAVGSLSGNTQKAERGSLTAVKDNLVLSNTSSSASVYYVFRPYSAGCFGTPSDPIGVRLYAAPVLAAIPPREVCSSSEAYPTTANIVLSSSSPDVVYTWIVDRINGRDITGYSEPLRNGARVPTQNPSQARSGLISDALSLPANATAQTLDYWITPWLFGCPGQAVLGRVKVNPLPTVTAPADREHCLGNADLRVAAEPLKGTAESFIWTGGIKAGLADHTVYGSGLPAYKVAASTTSVAVKVTITGKNDKGCKASTFFRIAVNPKPSITLGNSQILCTGPTIETAAQTNIKVSSPIAGTKYKWTATFIDFRPDGKSDVKLVSGNNELLALPVRESPREGGNFIRKITATTGSYAQVTFRLTPFLGGCAGEGKDTDVIVKGVNLAGGVSNNSPDVCSGGTTNIKIGKEGDGNIYSWEGINTSNNVLGYTPSKESGPTTISDILTIINTKRDSTVYHITPRRRFINADGKEYYCDGKSVSTTVFVNPIPVLSLSPDTASVCSGESVVITPSLNLVPPESNEVYYSWEVTPNGVGARSSSGFQKNIPQQVLTNDNASESSVTYTVTPQYKPAAGGTCKGLPATSTYQVSSRARTSISKIPESVCLGDKVTLKTDSKGTHYQWLKNGKTIPEASGDSYVVPTDSVSVSSYAVRVTTTGCGSGTSESRKVQVSAEAYFTGGNATMDKAVAAMGEAVKFSYSGPKAEYLWDFNDNTSMLNVESVSHSYSKAGTYYPTLKATKSGQAACTKTFSFSLEIRSAKSTITAMYGVFPIPARDKLTISSNEDDLQHIALSDMSGKMVLNEGVKGRNVTLSVAHLAQGIYLLTITNTAGEVKRLEIAKE